MAKTKATSTKTGRKPGKKSSKKSSKKAAKKSASKRLSKKPPKKAAKKSASKKSSKKSSKKAAKKSASKRLSKKPSKKPGKKSASKRTGKKPSRAGLPLKISVGRKTIDFEKLAKESEAVTAKMRGLADALRKSGHARVKNPGRYRFDAKTGKYVDLDTGAQVELIGTLEERREAREVLSAVNEALKFAKQIESDSERVQKELDDQVEVLKKDIEAAKEASEQHAKQIEAIKAAKKREAKLKADAVAKMKEYEKAIAGGENAVILDMQKRKAKEAEKKATEERKRAEAAEKEAKKASKELEAAEKKVKKTSKATEEKVKKAESANDKMVRKAKDAAKRAGIPEARFKQLLKQGQAGKSTCADVDECRAFIATAVPALNRAVKEAFAKGASETKELKKMLTSAKQDVARLRKGISEAFKDGKITSAERKKVLSQLDTFEKRLSAEAKKAKSASKGKAATADKSASKSKSKGKKKSKAKAKSKSKAPSKSAADTAEAASGDESKPEKAKKAKGKKGKKAKGKKSTAKGKKAKAKSKASAAPKEAQAEKAPSKGKKGKKAKKSAGKAKAAPKKAKGKKPAAAKAATAGKPAAAPKKAKTKGKKPAADKAATAGKSAAAPKKAKTKGKQISKAAVKGLSKEKLQKLAANALGRLRAIRKEACDDRGLVPNPSMPYVTEYPYGGGESYGPSGIPALPQRSEYQPAMAYGEEVYEQSLYMPDRNPEYMESYEGYYEDRPQMVTNPEEIEEIKARLLSY